MTTILPTVPFWIFAVFEPISLIAGAIAPVVAPAFFVSTQLPYLKAHPLIPTEHVLALQLGNLYSCLCLFGLFILNSTSEANVVHAYILVLWISDIGHVGATAWVMGERFFDVANWTANATTMGNLGVTSFLFTARTLYLLGFLGKDKNPKKRVKKA